MAGIGFVLRKLADRDDLLGVVRAYGHSAMASSGPWLFTVFALATIMFVNQSFATRYELYEFRLLVIYNFAFSLVITAPVFMVATRFLADAIHNKDVSQAPGMLISALGMIYAVQLPLGVAFYLGYADLASPVALAAIINFLLISSVWVIGVFLTALKDYRTVTWSFGVGVCITIFASGILGLQFGTAGMLNGFNLGLTVIIAALLARIYAEYPYRLEPPRHFLSYFRTYWELALSGLFYNLAVWVDKWVLWFAPEAERLPNKLLLYSNYDSAMFLAYLTIVPALAMFVLTVETHFFRHYLRFYRDIQRGVTFESIQKNHVRMMASLFGSARNFLVLQGSITLVTILMAPSIFKWLGVNYAQLGIFRFGVLGAFLHACVLFLSVLFSYFDHRRAALIIAIVFFVTNGAFAWITMQLGTTWYGYGYVMSAMVTFVLAAILFARYVYRLPYHTFITRNQSVQDA